MQVDVTWTKLHLCDMFHCTFSFDYDEKTWCKRKAKRKTQLKICQCESCKRAKYCFQEFHYYFCHKQLLSPSSLEQTKKMIAGSLLSEMACNTDTVYITVQRSLSPLLSCSFLGVCMQIMQFIDRAYAVNENEMRVTPKKRMMFSLWSAWSKCCSHVNKCREQDFSVWLHRALHISSLPFPT